MNTAQTAIERHLSSLPLARLIELRAASGIDTRSAIDSEAGVARKGESPTAESGDAHT